MQDLILLNSFQKLTHKFSRLTIMLALASIPFYSSTSEAYLCSKALSFETKSESQELEPVLLDGVLVRRLQICVGDSACVVLLDKPAIQDSLRDNLLMHKILSGQARLYKDQSYNSPSLNCHGFTFLWHRIPGITNRMWIPIGKNSGSKNSFLEILNHYFSFVEMIFGKKDVLEIENNSQVKENQVIVFFNLDQEVVHSGLIIKEQLQDGRFVNWIRSKLGSRQVAELPIQTLMLLYQPAFIVIYERSQQP